MGGGVSIGNALAEGRRRVGLTITEVSQRTCIRETIVRGIERDDFSACGGDFYARGHIRSIARAVGIDPEPLIEEYDATEGAPEAISAAEIFEPATALKIREPRRPNWTVAVVIALVALVGVGAFAYLRLGSQNSPPKPAAHPSVATAGQRPLRPKPKPSPSYPANRLYIQVTASHDCWVGITSAAGKLLYNGTVYAGSAAHWTEYHQVYLSLGNPSGIRLRVNGKNPMPAGQVGPLTLNLSPGHIPSH